MRHSGDAGQTQGHNDVDRIRHHCSCAGAPYAESFSLMQCEIFAALDTSPEEMDAWPGSCKIVLTVANAKSDVWWK